jgi:ABC-type cobalamin transport system permease subunit
VSDFEFTRGGLWPWLLALPVVWALLWLVLDRSRMAMLRYGAEPNVRLATPLWRSRSRLCVLARSALG